VRFGVGAGCFDCVHAGIVADSAAERN
jgi:hypothetical protein